MCSMDVLMEWILQPENFKQYKITNDECEEKRIGSVSVRSAKKHFDDRGFYSRDISSISSKLHNLFSDYLTHNKLMSNHGSSRFIGNEVMKRIQDKVCPRFEEFHALMTAKTLIKRKNQSVDRDTRISSENTSISEQQPTQQNSTVSEQQQIQKNFSSSEVQEHIEISVPHTLSPEPKKNTAIPNGQIFLETIQNILAENYKDNEKRLKSHIEKVIENKYNENRRRDRERIEAIEMEIRQRDREGRIDDFEEKRKSNEERRKDRELEEKKKEIDERRRIFRIEKKTDIVKTMFTMNTIDVDCFNEWMGALVKEIDEIPGE